VDQPEEIRIPLVWDGLDEIPVIFANQFLIQHLPGEFVLTLCTFVNPPLLGSPEEQEEQAKKLTEIAVKVHGRYALTRRRMVELIQVLQENLEKHDQQVEALGGTDDRDQ
jgi:hypothetical protein